jgi:hypothetical protein
LCLGSGCCFGLGFSFGSESRCFPFRLRFCSCLRFCTTLLFLYTRQLAICPLDQKLSSALHILYGLCIGSACVCCVDCDRLSILAWAFVLTSRDHYDREDWSEGYCHYFRHSFSFRNAKRSK